MDDLGVPQKNGLFTIKTPSPFTYHLPFTQHLDNNFCSFGYISVSASKCILLSGLLYAVTQAQRELLTKCHALHDFAMIFINCPS